MHDIKEYMSYDPDTGLFTWIKKLGRSRFGPGDVAGTTDKRGYVNIMFRGKRYLAHRLAVYYQTGSMPSASIEIDHRDNNKSNNIYTNLRLATKSQNGSNRPGRGKLYKGVSHYKRNDTYQASITVNGKKISLGYFKTAEEARDAYLKGSEKYFGEFAYHTSQQKSGE